MHGRVLGCEYVCVCGWVGCLFLTVDHTIVLFHRLEQLCNSENILK